jgi:ABC-type uncharacterized transport system involved in gliding motility auxiliary subunit
VGDEGKSLEKDFRYAQDSLSQAGFQVRPLPPGEEIPADLPVLVVIGGAESLETDALERIDAYIRGGGRALFAVEALLAEFQNQPIVRPLEDKGLLRLLASYGATVLPELVLDRSALMLQYQRGMPNGALQYFITPYPLWFSVLPENGNPASPVTSRFAGLDVFWANHLALNPPDGVEALPLFTTTPKAWLQTKDFSISPEIEMLLAQERGATEGAKILAASLSGHFPSAGAAGASPAPKSGDAADIGEAPAGRIIVVADADLASGVIQRQQNLDFLVQAALYLSNDDDIISIRNRQSGGGRLDKITGREERSRAMSFATWFNILAMPLLIVALGILAAWKRKKDARARD